MRRRTIVYDTLVESDAAIMGTLLYSGYLTAEKDLGEGRCLLRIPNGEVLACFRILAAQYNEGVRKEGGCLLLRDVLDGNVPGIESDIMRSLERSISVKEGGDGFTDITLEHSERKVAVIIGVKQVHEVGMMEKTVEDALDQIERKRYAARLESYSYKVMKYGICVSGKKVLVKTK